jgi:hypothetical protein
MLPRKSLWQRLNVRFLALFGVLALLPLAVTASLTLLSTYHLFERDVKDRQYQLTSLLAQQMAQFLEHSQRELTSVGHTVVVFPAIRTMVLQDFALSNPLYSELRVLDVEGQELSYVRHQQLITRARNAAMDELFFRPMRGENYFSAVRFDGRISQLTVAFPIYEAEQIRGVVVGVLNLETPLTLLQNQDVQRVGYVYLMDKRGTLIHSTNAAEPRVSFSALPPIQQIIGGEIASET